MFRDNWPYVVVWLGLTMVLWTVVSAVQKQAETVEPRVHETNGMTYHIWTVNGSVAVVNITKDKAEIEALSVSR